MIGAKFDIKKFDETGDLGLWRVKMRALLIQHGCEAALEVLPADMKAEAKAELNKKAHSEALTLKDVMATLNLKKIIERSKANGDNGEGLYVRGTTNRMDSHQSRGNSRSKSRGGRHKCYICQSEDHLKKNCPKNNRKKSTSYVKKDDQPSSSGLIYEGPEVMMVMSVDHLLEWIINSEGSYHMTPFLDLFFDFLECDRARYIPELNRKLISLGTLEKKVYTITLQSGEVKVINSSIVVLSGSRRDNCLYSLDGHAVAGELNASVEEKHSRAQVWHKRLGHISEAGLQVLKKQGLFGKKSLVYILKFKHEAYGKFKEWKQLVENHTRRTVKKSRTDNGLEFYNWEFEQLCINSGIARHLTIVGTLPQENGLVDQMNRTLMDKKNEKDEIGSLETRSNKFCGGEEDEKELLEMGEVGGSPFGGGKGGEE
ncbi:retrovirus-related pol polyprotein from transposon TNT 1-94 [Tanacetum coccineum]